MSKIVLDTNVLLSALVFGGKPRDILNACIEGDHSLAISNHILEELRGVLEGHKFRYPASVTQAILNELIAISELVAPSKHLSIIKSDPDDNRILECAMTAKVDVIVSGDVDLLELGEFQGIHILSPAEFIEELKE